MADDSGRPPSRAERREERRQRERERMAKHGGGLRRVYREAIIKRLAALQQRPARRRRKQ